MLRHAIALIALTFFLASSCFAHARLENSSPADKAQLAKAPVEMTLSFSEAGSIGTVKLLSNGKELPIAADFSPAAARSFRFRLPKLAAGSYTVQWSVMSEDDGHVTQGTLTFTVTS